MIKSLSTCSTLAWSSGPTVLMRMKTNGGMSNGLTRVCCAGPPEVRAFAQALGGRATRDRMAARELVYSAEAVQPGPRALPDTATQELRALLLRRRKGLRG